MARGTIRKRKGKTGTSYQAMIRINGRLKTKTFKRKADAEEFLTSVGHEINEGTYRDIKKATFGEYAEFWKETYLIKPNYKSHSIHNYRFQLKHFLIPAFGDYNLSSITTAHINSAISQWLKKGISPKTITGSITTLRVIFRSAVADGYLKIVPEHGINLPKPKKCGRALNLKEIRALIEHTPERWKALILTAVLTGVRQGELLALRWEDIDWKENVIHVKRAVTYLHGKIWGLKFGESRFEFHPPKTPASIREIDMSPVLRQELLKQYLKSPKTGLVFRTKSGNPLQGPNLRNVLSRIRNKAQLGHFRWHDLSYVLSPIMFLVSTSGFLYSSLVFCKG